MTNINTEPEAKASFKHPPVKTDNEPSLSPITGPTLTINEIPETEPSEDDPLNQWRDFQSSWSGKPRWNSGDLMMAFSELRRFFSDHIKTYSLEAFNIDTFKKLGTACSANFRYGLQVAPAAISTSADFRYGLQVAPAAISTSLKILLETQLSEILPTDKTLARFIVDSNINTSRIEVPAPFATCLRQTISHCQLLWDAAFRLPDGPPDGMPDGMPDITGLISDFIIVVMRFRALDAELLFQNPGNVVHSAIVKTFPAWDTTLGDLDVHLNLNQGSCMN